MKSRDTEENKANLSLYLEINKSEAQIPVA